MLQRGKGGRSFPEKKSCLSIAVQSALGQIRRSHEQRSLVGPNGLCLRQFTRKIEAARAIFRPSGSLVLETLAAVDSSRGILLQTNFPSILFQCVISASDLDTPFAGVALDQKTEAHRRRKVAPTSRPSVIAGLLRGRLIRGVARLGFHACRNSDLSRDHQSWETPIRGADVPRVVRQLLGFQAVAGARSDKVVSQCLNQWLSNLDSRTGRGRPGRVRRCVHWRILLPGGRRMPDGWYGTQSRGFRFWGRMDRMGRPQ